MIRRISVLLLGAVFAFTAFGRDEYTRIFDKTLEVRTGTKLYLEHKMGEILIRTHSQPDVAIHAEIKVSAPDANQARMFADKVEIVVESSPAELSIRTRYPDSGSAFFGFRNISYTVRYEVTIPETAPVEVRNAFGAVSVTGVKASSDVTTSHGDIEWRDGRGTQRLQTSFANVHVANNAGDVDVEESNGNVDAGDVSGALNVRDRFGTVTVARAEKGVSVVNSNGSVEVTDSGGVGEIRNSFGNVLVHGFRGDLTVNNTNGRVEALNVGGAAELNTTYGEVHFAKIGGKLAVRANNSKISGEGVGGALIVENSYGGVTVSNVQGAVSIHSGNGEVRLSKVGGEANVKTSYAAVEANNIGGALMVEDTNGSVTASHTRGAQVSTSFASVVLDSISGPLRIVDQNGAVDASSAGTQGSCQPILIRTSYSTLRVHVPGDASYRVAARTSFASIRTDFPLTGAGSLSNDNLNGAIGSGHCEMTLTDNNGAIEILKGGF